ncbi:MAG: P-II family nitrogen regulator [Polyangiaceae bacterium]
MNKVDILLRPAFWDRARAALSTLGGQVTLREVRTFGRVPARREVYRGSACALELTPELELTMQVADEQLERTVAALVTIDPEAEILVSRIESIVRSGRQAPAAIEPGLRATTASRVGPLSLHWAATHA